MPRSLANLPFEDVYDDLVATEAALGADPDAVDFAPRVAALADQWETETKAVRAARRIAVGKQQIAVVRDADLDDVVLDFSDALLHAVDKDRKSPRFVRYFKLAPSRFVRIGRLIEAKTVQAWVPAIAQEPEATVAAFAQPLGDRAQSSVAALDESAIAAGNAASVRIRTWDEFIKTADATRDALHADLVKRGQEKKKPRDWAGRFFPVAAHGRRAADDDTDGPTT